MIDLLIQAVIYTTTVIATLRAGSRAIYAIHHAEIGVMDGPLILSPQDVAAIKNQGDDEVEVSPLWEYAFGFSEAVRLLHDEDRLSDGEIHRGNWKEEEEASHYYSMAWPHKTLQEIQSSKEIGKEDNRAVDSLGNKDPHIKNEGSLVAVQLGEIKRWREHGFLQAMKRYITSRTDDVSHLYETFKDLCQEIWTCHPLFGSNNIFRRKEYSNSHEEDLHTVFEDEHLNFDIFYSTTITIPTAPANSTLHDIPTTSHERLVQLKAFAPKVFARLRSRFEVREEAFLASILKSGPFVSFQSNSKGALRVGGFFFFSRDGAYMIKTIKKAELKTILEMLPKYYAFMNQNAKRSLLTRFCGLYSVKFSDVGANSSDDEEKYFLVMNSVFPPEASQFISERFDLKGSTVGRECSEEEKQAKGSHAVLKDVDILKEVEVMRSISPTFALPDCGICIGPTAKAALLSQLRRDLALLVECSVMDYSLLVGVVNMDVIDDGDSAKTLTKNEIDKLLKANKVINRSQTLRLLHALSRPLQELGAPAMTICRAAYNGVQTTLSTVLTLPFPYYGADKCGVDGGCFSVMRGRRLGKRAVYYMGVIDFLQPWTTQKVLENQLKGVLGYNRSAISCVHPKDYAERFLNFMDKVIT